MYGISYMYSQSNILNEQKLWLFSGKKGYEQVFFFFEISNFQPENILVAQLY